MSRKSFLHDELSRSDQPASCRVSLNSSKISQNSTDQGKQIIGKADKSFASNEKNDIRKPQTMNSNLTHPESKTKNKNNNGGFLHSIKKNLVPEKAPRNALIKTKQDLKLNLAPNTLNVAGNSQQNKGTKLLESTKLQEKAEPAKLIDNEIKMVSKGRNGYLQENFRVAESEVSKGCSRAANPEKETFGNVSPDDTVIYSQIKTTKNSGQTSISSSAGQPSVDNRKGKENLQSGPKLDETTTIIKTESFSDLQNSGQKEHSHRETNMPSTPSSSRCEEDISESTFNQLKCKFEAIADNSIVKNVKDNEHFLNRTFKIANSQTNNTAIKIPIQIDNSVKNGNILPKGMSKRNDINKKSEQLNSLKKGGKIVHQSDLRDVKEASSLSLSSKNISLLKDEPDRPEIGRCLKKSATDVSYAKLEMAKETNAADRSSQAENTSSQSPRQSFLAKRKLLEEKFNLVGGGKLAIKQDAVPSTPRKSLISCTPPETTPTSEQGHFKMVSSSISECHLSSSLSKTTSPILAPTSSLAAAKMSSLSYSSPSLSELKPLSLHVNVSSLHKISGTISVGSPPPRTDSVFETAPADKCGSGTASPSDIERQENFQSNRKMLYQLLGKKTPTKKEQNGQNRGEIQPDVQRAKSTSDLHSAVDEGVAKQDSNGDQHKSMTYEEIFEDNSPREVPTTPINNQADHTTGKQPRSIGPRASISPGPFLDPNKRSTKPEKSSTLATLVGNGNPKLMQSSWRELSEALEGHLPRCQLAKNSKGKISKKNLNKVGVLGGSPSALQPVTASKTRKLSSALAEPAMDNPDGVARGGQDTNGSYHVYEQILYQPGSQGLPAAGQVDDLGYLEPNSSRSKSLVEPPPIPPIPGAWTRRKGSRGSSRSLTNRKFSWKFFVFKSGTKETQC